VETNSFKNWWNSKDNELRRDPIEAAQQLLVPAKSVEEVYARQGMVPSEVKVEPVVEEPKVEEPMVKLEEPEPVITEPMDEEEPVVKAPKEPEVFDPEGFGYDYETAKQKGLDPKDIVRQDLYSGEDKYFKENPNVAGMMTEDNRVIINPYSKLTDEEKDTVRINETLRLNFKQDNIVPNIEISEEQRSFFKGTPYENNEAAMKQTIMARILTGDPSAKATEEQLKEAETDLFKAYKENIDHWGSVVPASDEDKLKYNLPEESYLLVKGKQHKTWDKAVQGEEARGFKVEKHGDRYYSVPDISTVPMDKEEPIQSEDIQPTETIKEEPVSKYTEKDLQERELALVNDVYDMLEEFEGKFGDNTGAADTVDRGLTKKEWQRQKDRANNQNMTPQEASIAFLKENYVKFYNELPGFKDLDWSLQRDILNESYNLGMNDLVNPKKYPKFMQAVNNQDPEQIFFNLLDTANTGGKSSKGIAVRRAKLYNKWTESKIKTVEQLKDGTIIYSTEEGELFRYRKPKADRSDPGKVKL